MDRILNEPLTEYLIVKKELLKDNQFAKKFTSEFKEIIENNGFTQEILRKYLHELPTLGQR